MVEEEEAGWFLCLSELAGFTPASNSRVKKKKKNSTRFLGSSSSAYPTGLWYYYAQNLEPKSPPQEWLQSKNKAPLLQVNSGPSVCQKQEQHRRDPEQGTQGVYIGEEPWGIPDFQAWNWLPPYDGRVLSRPEGNSQLSLPEGKARPLGTQRLVSFPCSRIGWFCVSGRDGSASGAKLCFYLPFCTQGKYL